MKRILMLGYGRVGKVFARLAQDAAITVFDRVRAVSPFPQVPENDLSLLGPDDLAPYDIVVNFLPVSFNRQVLGLVADSECSYLDLSCQDVRTPEHLAFQDHFQERFLLASAGIAPGLDNLLAASLVDQGAKRIEIFLIEHLFSPNPRPSWCIEDVLISMTDRPVSWSGGWLRSHENFSDPESILTCQGTFTCYRFFGEEILTLGHRFPGTGFSLRAGGAEIESARQLFLESKALGLDCVRERLEAASAGGGPEPDGIFGMVLQSDAGRAEVFLKSGGCLEREGMPGNHISFHTAAVAWAMLETLLEHPLKGVYYPEMLPGHLQHRILEKIRNHACFWEITPRPSG